MTKKEDIFQELNELKSPLATFTRQNVYIVPAGYFEGLAAQVMNRIKALEATDAAADPIAIGLSYLAPSFINISRQMPYAVPAGYFEGLADKVMELVRENNDYLEKESFGQSAKEELETLSPLLSGMKKTMSSRTGHSGGPYTVPAGYFENLTENRNKPAAKIVSFAHRNWFSYAAAAVVAGVIVLAGLVYLSSRNNVDPVGQPYAWVKKSIKKVDKADIDAFVNLADEELSNQASVAAIPVSPGEIKELMKDVSDKEIQDFLDTTPDAETNENAMMN